MEKIKLPRPTLILGCGILSTGKSTLYAELIPKIADVCILNKDTINKSFLKTAQDCEELIDSYKLSGPEISLKGDHYREHIWRQSYLCMLGLARDNLLVGKHPLLEGNFTKEIRWGYLEKIVYPFFNEVDCQIKILFCHAPEEVIKERLKKRKDYRDKFSLEPELWSKLMQDQPPLPPEIEQDSRILKLDTHANSLKENVQKSIDYLLAN